MIDDPKKIEELLKASPELQPPTDLPRRIMEEIGRRKISPFNRFRGWFLKTGSLRLSPAQLSLGTLLIAIGSFWLGTAIDHSTDMTNRNQTALLAPEMIHDAQASFFIGRGLIRSGNAKLALAYLNEAEQLNPQDAEYNHWQGVAYWALGQKNQEKNSYLRSLAKQPDFLPSLLNLGHIALENGNYAQAVSLYNKVLQTEPQSPEALYNSGLASLLYQKKKTALKAFADYLTYYPQGKWAERALRHMHHLHDYRFQNFRLGTTNLILNSATLLGGESRARTIDLQRIGSIVSLHPELELHIVVFKQDKTLARQEAQKLKKDLKILNPAIQTIRTSWFDNSTPSTKTKSLINLQQENSLLLFTKPPSPPKRTSA